MTGLERAKTFYLILVIALANNGFTLLRGVGARNSYNAIDLGLLLVLFGTLFLVVLYGKTQIFRNSITIFICFYIFFVGVHIALPSFKYGQSLIDGFIAARHQIYYLSYFLFLILLVDISYIIKLLNALTYVGIIISILAIIHHFYPIIFVGVWEHDIFRDGVKRGYVPGMWMMSFLLLWQFTKWVVCVKTSVKSMSTVYTIFFVGIHIFRQTRGLILGTFGAIIITLILKRKYGVLAAIATTFICFMITISVVGKTNHIANLFESSYKDVTEESGTWGSRVNQLDDAWQTFIENPIIGSGSIAIRMLPDEAKSKEEMEMAMRAYKADLGYASWVKSYGTVGIVMLVYIGFSIIKYIKKLKITQNEDFNVLKIFLTMYFIFVAISFITINHLMYPPGIVLFCLAAAILTRLSVSQDKQVRKAFLVPDTKLGIIRKAQVDVRAGHYEELPKTGQNILHSCIFSRFH